MQPVSRRSLRGLGSQNRRRMVSKWPPDKAALWHGPPCRPDRSGRCGASTRSIDSGQEPARDCAGQRLASSGSLCVARLSEPAIKAAIADPDPMVRMVAAQALPPSPSRPMIEAILPLLSDPIRAVRVETARVIAGVDPQTMTPLQRSAFTNAYQELVSAEMIDADRPEAHLNLGLLKTRRQQPATLKPNTARPFVLTPSSSQRW